MSLFTAPVGQNAYQAILMQRYANAWTPFVRTVNRYGSGPIGGVALAANVVQAMPYMPQRCGRRFAPIPVSGAAALVGATGGAGYAANDFVTFSPVNGGRSVVVKILTVTAGVPTNIQVIDPGSGLLGGGTGVNSLTIQTAVLNQLSTTGVGSGSTWTATLSVGLGQGPQPRSDA